MIYRIAMRQKDEIYKYMYMYGCMCMWVVRVGVSISVCLFRITLSSEGDPKVNSLGQYIKI